MKVKPLILLFFITLCGFSQRQNDNELLYKDYREDQFYFSSTYNLLNIKPNSVGQSGFSSGFHAGFIRDMPINEQRNLALGIGLGVSSNSYNQNILIETANNNVIYRIINGSAGNVSKNKFTTYLIEVPFEFRWRTSTASSYNFWRIYTGFKVGYQVFNSSRFRSDFGDVNLFNIEDFNRLQYGLTLSAGYGTWNFYLYYGLNSIFNSNAMLNGEPIRMKSLKLGLMFYIL
jgi:hypothetical protein